MMPRRPYLMITLVLSTLCAPQTSHTASSPEMCDANYLDSGWPAGHLPLLSPDGRCGHLGLDVSNGTCSSVSSSSLPLQVPLPGRGVEPVCHAGSYMGVNHVTPSRLSLEEPQGGELVSSYPFPSGLNQSHEDVCCSGGSRMLYARSLKPQYEDNPEVVWGGFAYPRYRGGGEEVEYYNWTEFSLSSINLSNIWLELPTIGSHRKLLGAHGKSTSKENLHRRLQAILFHNEGVARAAVIVIALALFGLLCTIAGLLLWCMCNIKRLEDQKPIQQSELCSSGPRRYSHNELATATGGFPEEGKIGRGGSGPVYRGFLSDQDRHVAIKLLSQGLREQVMKEFMAEVKIMTRLRHRNIVLLLGWSDGPGGLMLVYEFIPNGSLDEHLYDPRILLTWTDRYKIGLGVGSAILYLQTECEQCVLHGDIKPANILLDPSYNAKLGDFGLARLVNHGTDSHPTEVIAGTLGYMDPEFFNNQRRSPESDVYSFGVVLLEIACGRRPTTTQSNGTSVLLSWVRDMYGKNSILGVADRRLDGEFDEWEMRRVLVTGLWCTHRDQRQRPSIAQAMDLLRRHDAELPVLDLANYCPGTVRSLEEMDYCDCSSAEHSAFDNFSAETAYHTSEHTTFQLEH